MKTLKTQVELELDLLIKDFQKRILLEKEEFFKLLDGYQRNYVESYENVRGHSQ